MNHIFRVIRFEFNALHNSVSVQPFKYISIAEPWLTDSCGDLLHILCDTYPNMEQKSQWKKLIEVRRWFDTHNENSNFEIWHISIEMKYWTAFTLNEWTDEWLMSTVNRSSKICLGYQNHNFELNHSWLHTIKLERARLVVMREY